MFNNIKFLPLFGLCALLLTTACEEEPFPIPELSVGSRRVLVEELTGVACTNCPDGAKELQSLQNSFGKENLIIVSLHSAGFFSNPLPDSEFDFRNPNVDALVSFLGVAEGYPTSAINRYFKPGNQTIYLNQPNWAGTVQEEFEKDFGLGLFATTTYDSTSRVLNIKVNIAPEETQPADVEKRLTILIAQDSIVDAQIDKGVKILNYMHRHVVRDVVTKSDGDVITEALPAGALVTKTYSYTIPADWVAKKCSIIAYVHHAGNPDKEILQSVEVKVIEN